jgi:Leucine-rich repeat (LRR) protein
MNIIREMSAENTLMSRSAPAHSFETPEECFIEARRRIAEARSTGATELDLRRLPHLQQLPADLVDLRRALKRLHLRKTEVIDISALAELKELEELDLFETPILELTPISNLTSLRSISVGKTRIRSVSPLAYLTSLTHLTLWQTEITDLSALSGLINLKILLLGSSPVIDLTPLKGMTELEQLRLEDMQINNLQPLGSLHNLFFLGLTNTPVGNLDPLGGLPRLGDLELNRTQGVDLSPLVNCPRPLHHLALNYTRNAHIAPLAKMTFLADAAQRNARSSHSRSGLTAFGADFASQPPFNRMMAAGVPFTVETINYLRRRQGLEPYFPSGYQPPTRFVPPIVRRV